MEKNITITIALLFVLVIAFLFTGCTSNIKNIPQTMSKVEKTRVYKESFDKVWEATLRALSEDETFKILEKSGGIIVTEYRTVDSKELSLFSTTFLGKTYKNSYTLNFIKINGNETEIKINVKLTANQAILLNREENNENVENYLRIKLFDKIGENL